MEIMFLVLKTFFSSFFLLFLVNLLFRCLPDGVDDIDSEDRDNPQLCSEYAVQIYSHLRQLEVSLRWSNEFILLTISLLPGPICPLRRPAVEQPGEREDEVCAGGLAGGGASSVQASSGKVYFN